MNAPLKPSIAATTISTKGQVVLPQAVRQRLGWRPGDKLIVEDGPEGVFLKREAKRPASRLEDVLGILKWNGPHYSMEEVRSRIGGALKAKWEQSDETGSAYEDDGRTR